jgi:hypothetical protein
MSEHEFELQEIPHDPPELEGERLRESVVSDVAASVNALAGTGAFGYAAVTFHSRRQRDADEARREAEMAALRAEMDAEMRVLRAQMGAEMRVLRRAQEFGFGVDDDYFGGIGVDDDYSGGFGIE